MKVMKEQMRLISAKMQSDIEKEKVIANEILNNLFEERVTSSAEIATQSGINSAEHAEQGKRAV